MSAEFLCRIMGLSLLLHLRVPDEDSAELPKELRTLSAELRLREVPGKLVQRPRWRGRVHVLEGLELKQSPSASVLGVSRPPRSLLNALPLRLALGRRASALSRTDASIGAKPLSTETTRARPARHPAAVARSAATTTSRRSGRCRDLHDRGASRRDGRVISGEQTRSIFRERPRAEGAARQPARSGACDGEAHRDEGISEVELRPFLGANHLDETCCSAGEKCGGVQPPRRRSSKGRRICGDATRGICGPRSGRGRALL